MEVEQTTTICRRTAQYIFGSEQLDYFRLKDKVLWSSASGWTSGSETIADLEKYRTFAIYSYGNLTGVLCEWDDNVIRGADIVEGVSAITVTVSFEFELTVSGNTATISKTQHIIHNGEKHSSSAAQIHKIVGIDPIIPDILKNILGEGGR